MVTRPQPPPAANDPPAAAGRERAAARRRRGGPGPGYGPTAQDLAARFPGVGAEIERSRQARVRLAVLAARLVQPQQAAVRIHDEMAGRDSRDAAACRRAAGDARGAAGDARRAARRAREIQRDGSARPG